MMTCYVAVTTTWREAKEALEKRLIETQDPKNPIVMMMDSGAVVTSLTSLNLPVCVV
mgnify:CR=1 FL=1